MLAAKRREAQLAQVFDMRPSSIALGGRSIIALHAVPDSSDKNYSVEFNPFESIASEDDSIPSAVEIRLPQTAAALTIEAGDFGDICIDDSEAREAKQIQTFSAYHQMEESRAQLKKALSERLPENKSYSALSVDDGVERLGLFVQLSENLHSSLDQQCCAFRAVQTEFLIEGCSFDGKPFFMYLEFPRDI